MPKPIYQDRPADAVAVLSTNVGGGDLRTVQICPDGIVHSRKGDFVVDAEAGRLVCEQFNAHGVDVPVDIEHATLDDRPGSRAEACGWIKQVWYEEGRGILALVQWLPETRDLIRAGKYAYLSPVLWIRSEDRKVTELHSCGITNKPAVPRMERLAATDRGSTLESNAMPDEGQQGSSGNRSMELVAAIAKALGLEGKSTEDILSAALAKLKGDADDGDKAVANSVRTRLKLQADAGTDEVVLALSLLESRGPATVEAADAKRAARDRVDELVKQNVLNPNDAGQVEAALSLARDDPKRFEALIANMSTAIPPGMTTGPVGMPAGRLRIINQAAEKFRNDADLQKQCGRDAWVGLALREAGLDPLTETEAKELV